MTLAEKLQALREQEGLARNLGRPLSKAEMSRALHAEHNERFSAAYVSQLESGARLHLTHRTRSILAAFFNVHPGYLVDDVAPPEPHHADADRISSWLRGQAQHFQDDYLVSKVMSELSGKAYPRKYFELLESLLTLPSHELDRLLEHGFRSAQVEQPTESG